MIAIKRAANTDSNGSDTLQGWWSLTQQCKDV